MRENIKAYELESTWLSLGYKGAASWMLSNKVIMTNSDMRELFVKLILKYIKPKDGPYPIDRISDIIYVYLSRGYNEQEIEEAIALARLEM